VLDQTEVPELENATFLEESSFGEAIAYPLVENIMNV